MSSRGERRGTHAPRITAKARRGGLAHNLHWSERNGDIMHAIDHGFACCERRGWDGCARYKRHKLYLRADPERKIRGNEGKHGCRLITYVLKWEGGGRRVVNREELWSYGK